MTPTNGAETRPARRFRVSTATAVLALIIIAPLVVTGVVNLHQFRKAYQTKVSNELSVMIERHSLTVDSFINDRLSDVRVIAREHPIERLTQPEFLRRVLSLMREEYHGAFVDLGLVNANGIQVAYAGPFNLLMADYSAAAWFQTPFQAKASSATFLPVCADRPTSSLQPRRRLATSSTSSRRPSISRHSTPSWKTYESAAPVLLSSSIGRAISRPTPISRWRSTALRGSISWKVASGQTESRSWTARMFSDGRPSSRSHRSNRAQWFLCYQQETSDAFAELRRCRISQPSF